jgi:uncharacterized protein (TIGR01619 family)
MTHYSKFIIGSIFVFLLFNSCQSRSNLKFESDWAPYFCKVNDTVASIFVDLGVKKIAPDKQRPKLIWVWVFIKSANENGFPKDEEFETLNKIEDQLTIEFSKSLKAVNVGRVTTAGRREFYFYSPSEKDFDKIVQRTMSNFRIYKYENGTKTDPSWTEYFDFLYPRPQQYQSIQNMKVIENLKKAGDKLEKPRNVSHWAYFKDSVSRKRFIDEVKTKGFRPNPEYLTFKSGEEFPYGIMVERTDKVDFNSIDSVILDLWNKAKELNGDYDGWETSVEK